MSQKPYFSATEAVHFGWTAARAHLKPMLILGTAALFLAMVGNALSRAGPGGALLGLGVQLLQLGVSLSLCRVALKCYDGESVELRQLVPLLDGFVPYLLTMLLYGLMVAVGLVVLIIPGFVMALAFGLAPLFVADGQRDPVEALRQSSRITRGSRLNLLALGLLLVGINLVGLLAAVVGLIFTVPLSMLAWVYAFRRLQGRTEALPAPTPTPSLGDGSAHLKGA